MVRNEKGGNERATTISDDPVKGLYIKRVYSPRYTIYCLKLTRDDDRAQEGRDGHEANKEREIREMSKQSKLTY